MVSIRCFREVGELRRTKSIPFKVFTWNTGAVLGLVPWASSTLPNSSAPRESNKDNNSLLVMHDPGMFLACSWQFEIAWRLQLATEKTPCAIEPRCSALSFSLRIPNFQATALESPAIFRIGHGRVVPFEDNEGDGLTSAICARAVLIRPLYCSSF